jgi:hypothetical protein
MGKVYLLMTHPSLPPAHRQAGTEGKGRGREIYKNPVEM